MDKKSNIEKKNSINTILGSFSVSHSPCKITKQSCSKIVHRSIGILEILQQFAHLFTRTRFNAVYNMKYHYKETFKLWSSRGGGKAQFCYDQVLRHKKQQNTCVKIDLVVCRAKIMQIEDSK